MNELVPWWRRFEAVTTDDGAGYATGRGRRIASVNAGWAADSRAALEHTMVPDVRGNPWLTRHTAAEQIADAPPPKVAPLTGPSTPQAGVDAPAAALPVWSRLGWAAALWFVGAHGGAGESTLAALDDSWAAAGHGWPGAPSSSRRPRAVIVARSHLAGLQAAQAVAQQWASGGVPSVQLLGLIIVADAPGRLPRPLRELQQVVSGGVPRAWTVPWVEAWRAMAPDESNIPRSVRSMCEQLRSLTNSAA